MVRNLFIAVLASCIFAVLLGLGTAYSVLSINGWQPEFETKTRAELMRVALSAVTSPEAKAYISEEDRTYFFGVWDVTAEGYHHFFIENRGTEDLILRLGRKTCGCTDFVITPERVPPGGRASCRLEFTADRQMTGRFSESGTILTNDPDNREIILAVEGMFTTPVVPIPAAVSVSNVAIGTTRTATLRIFGFENEPLQLFDPTWQDREHFDFHWEPSELTEEERADESFLGVARSVIEGTITIKPGLPAGPFRERFQVRTNFPSQENIVFSIGGQIVSGNIVISGRGHSSATGVTDLGTTTTGMPITRDIQIRFSGVAAPSASAAISSVEPAWLRAELLPPRDAGPLRFFDLRIEIPADAPTGNYGRLGDGNQAQIILETNDETTPILRIPLQFVVVGR